MQDRRRIKQRLAPKLTRPGAKGHTKSKTGCLTCKQRRKKCDEARPKCGGCVAAGWDCEFPPANAVAKRSRPPQQHGFGSATIARPSLLPDLTRQELEMFHFYSGYRMSGLGLILSSPGAEDLVIKMSVYEPCVRQGVLAASYAVRDSYWPAADRAERARNLGRLLRHYNLAIGEVVALRVEQEEANQEGAVKTSRPERIAAIMCASLVLATVDHISAHMFSAVLGEGESGGRSRTLFHLKAFSAILMDSRPVSLVDDGGGGAWDRKSQFDDDVSMMVHLVSTFLMQNALYDEEVKRFKAQRASAAAPHGWNSSGSRITEEEEGYYEMETYQDLRPVMALATIPGR
ncbi:uncharacterized protein PpBr36_06746 [Pyricularia pennisetigena]|uniref:uncharacterized protein n=1 Tax=Pyricularia pennisetigena TaxID=1578925 RepID=UPI0011523754|nr:uncharacterized protein PpBr36_06746 [Pyricularia pennisetigena]TLS23343.1 hypothetical protein PpBr36_06746 [Pyricularia pennisetigena]